MSSPYDVTPAMLALAALMRANLTPSPLNVVYDDIPVLFSDGAPFAFLEYKGGSNGPGDEYDNYGGSAHPTSQRVYTVEVIVAQALLSEVTTADQLTKAFVGTFYELIRQHATLDGALGDHGEIVATSDGLMPVQTSGTEVYLANTFTVQISDFIS